MDELSTDQDLSKSWSNKRVADTTLETRLGKTEEHPATKTFNDTEETSQTSESSYLKVTPIQRNSEDLLEDEFCSTVNGCESPKNLVIANKEQMEVSERDSKTNEGVNIKSEPSNDLDQIQDNSSDPPNGIASTSVQNLNYFYEAQQYLNRLHLLRQAPTEESNFMDSQKGIASTSMQPYGYEDDATWNCFPLDLSYKSILEVSYDNYKLALLQNQQCTPRKRATWYYCHHCGHKSKSRSNLKLHIISIHLGKKPFQCELCNYGTNRVVYLKDHINSVHYNMKPFQCPECDYRASTKGNLNQHINSIHVGEKPFQCPYCTSRMSQRSKLNQHIKSVHNGEKPHQCPHCDYRASQKSSLNLHIKHIHQGERPFECPHCDHRTTTKSKLNLHVNSVHVRMKPFHCPLCDHKTSEKNKLTQHFNSVHKGENPFQCPYCDTRMNQQRHLFRHINSVHKEEQLRCAFSLGISPKAHNL